MFEMEGTSERPALGHAQERHTAADLEGKTGLPGPTGARGAERSSGVGIYIYIYDRWFASGQNLGFHGLSKS